MKLFVLLPVYNEEASIPSLIPKIHKTLSSASIDYKIIVCNDGSEDGTAELLYSASLEYPLYIITHSINRGLGETSRDNFEAAAELSEDSDIIVRLDCDDTHEPDFILSMIDKIQDGYDIVIASRFTPGGGQKGVSKYRAFISSCANLFMKLFFPMRGVKDYSCGYRAYSAAIIKKAIRIYGNSFIQLKGLGFTCTLEKLIKLHMLDSSIIEIPFILNYDKKTGPSKMIGSITTLGYVVMVVMNYWPWGGWRSQKKGRLIDKSRKK